MGRKNKKKQQRKAQAATETQRQAPAAEEAHRQAEAAAAAAAEDARVKEQDSQIYRKLVCDGDFPLSDFAKQCREAHLNGDTQKVYEIMKRGAESGNAPSMGAYAFRLIEGTDNNSRFIRALPWILEGAIRGHKGCIINLGAIYRDAKPFMPLALQRYWAKLVDGGDKFRRVVEHCKNEIGQACFMCKKEDSETVTLEKCSKCRCYFYCSKECQLEHWNQPYNHKGECKQLQILKKYHKPHFRAIHEAAIRGSDIPELDMLRRKLGLSRPKDEEFEELLDDLDNISNSIIDEEGRTPKDYSELLINPRDDGTVRLGSIPTFLGTSTCEESAASQRTRPNGNLSSDNTQAGND